MGQDEWDIVDDGAESRITGMRFIKVESIPLEKETMSSAGSSFSIGACAQDADVFCDASVARPTNSQSVLLSVERMSGMCVEDLLQYYDKVAALEGSLVIDGCIGSFGDERLDVELAGKAPELADSARVAFLPPSRGSEIIEAAFSEEAAGRAWLLI